ncbi:glycosyltransferase family 4 protein [uncultured Roseobacter sp.]|uniref:glycosyltransferase family 4 protein n=1 Tax=uncultured Roseobacter sp. TaxID=114847 RepID=UPI00262714E7|nr:glycosyltransferase family 4 protein [uncultured Roseobacter sp.]
MRISFILPFASLSGGIRVIATYARELTQAGHEVTVISRPLRVKTSPLRTLVNRITGKARARAREDRTTPFLDFLGDRHVVLDRFRPVTPRDVPDGDAVIATWWETAESVAQLPSTKGKKFYLLQDYETFGNLPAEDVATSYTLPLHKIAVSGYIRDCVRENHGVSDITVIPNAVDTKQFDAPPRARNTPLKVGFLYHAHPRKRVDLALAAVLAAKRLVPDLRVVAFGRGWPAEEFGLPDWVDYHQSPPQAEIPKLYAACDLWLFTSDHEGFGLPLLEAMACRTPVLATRAGAAADLIDGTNGDLLAADPEAFATKIAEVAQMTPEAWRAMSDAAYQTAHSYTWTDAAQRLVTEIQATEGTSS